MTTPTVITKSVEHEVPDGQSFTEVTTEAISSVEVGEDAKGTIYVKSSKAYHADPAEAAIASVAAFVRADEAIRAIQAERRQRALDEAQQDLAEKLERSTETATQAREPAHA